MQGAPFTTNKKQLHKRLSPEPYSSGGSFSNGDKSFATDWLTASNSGHGSNDSSKRALHPQQQQLPPLAWTCCSSRRRRFKATALGICTCAAVALVVVLLLFLGDRAPEFPSEVQGTKRERETRRTAYSEEYVVCDGYRKDYGIIPENSWGTAPKSIQQSWAKMSCDRVLGMNGFSLDDPPSGGRDRSIVLVWSNIRGWLDYLRPSFVADARDTCATECVFTSDRDLLPRANGVLFHGPTHQRRDGFPEKKPPGVDYVFANLEPTTSKPLQALLNDTKFMSTIDVMMTYERNSDVPLGYVGSSSTSRYFKAPKASFKEKDGFGSPDAIAAFVSNCKAFGARNRMSYMEELMQHATLHSFGYCLHNREEPQLVPGGGATNRQENKIAVLKRYKFLLAFENNNELRDYVTEKVYNGLQSGTLPVYWGAENVDDFVPSGSVVKASDFSSPAELAKHLKMLAADEEAYEAYFKWRDDPQEERRFEENVIARSAYGVNAMCRLCDRVLKKSKQLR